MGSRPLSENPVSRDLGRFYCWCQELRSSSHVTFCSDSRLAEGTVATDRDSKSSRLRRRKTVPFQAIAHLDSRLGRHHSGKVYWCTQIPGTEVERLAIE